MIADKSRHAIDGLLRQRLDRPYIRKNGKLAPASWAEALAAIAARVKGVSGARIAAIAGDMADAEALIALKDLMTALGSPNLECRQDGGRFDPSARAGYLFNTTIAGIEAADAFLIVGSNPRWEAPIVNARIRKRFLALREGFQAGVIGANLDLTYPTAYLGAGPQTLADVAEGRHGFAEILRAATAPMLILARARSLGRTASRFMRSPASSRKTSVSCARLEWIQCPASRGGACRRARSWLCPRRERA